MLTCAMVMAAALGGCSNVTDAITKPSDAGWFSKPFEGFSKPIWGSGGSAKTVSLGPEGPVPPEDLVGPDGRCGPAAMAQVAQEPQPQAQAPTPVAERQVGSMAGDLAGAPMPQGPTPTAASAHLEADSAPVQAAPAVVGGISLGMTECQAVRRAGLPSNVTIGVGDQGARKTVLTYLGGSWPGIYTFQGGRLKEIAEAPQPEKPVKPIKKKPSKAKAKTARHGASTVYVQ